MRACLAFILLCLAPLLSCAAGKDRVREDCQLLWYADEDEDGYGNPDDALQGCQIEGRVLNGLDCADREAAIHPGSNEICDGEDNDCDGVTDGSDAAGAQLWYADADGDGYGNPDATATACDAPAGYTDDDDDCDDGHPEASPEGVEVCDGLDNDCDGLIDDEDKDEDGLEQATWYLDADGDGWGTASSSVEACHQPSGYIGRAGDCDDGDAEVNPDAEEIWYDGQDQDCDDANDFDQDGDHRAAADHGGDDCDDEDASISPAAEETWYDGVDQDCDGWSDYDQDGDGYDCQDYGGEDCDDEDSGVYPGLPDDDYDGADDDCNGAIDDDIALADADAVLYGEDASDYVGAALAFTGDVNADGYDDFLAGSEFHTGSAGNKSGVAYLLLGPVSSGSLADADVALEGEAADDGAGCAVAGGSDLNGDGIADMVVGASLAGSNTGLVYILAGAAGWGSDDEVYLSEAFSILSGELAGGLAGSSLALVGDVDGDGQDDLLVGAPAERGTVYLVTDPGSGQASLSTAEATWAGELGDGNAGTSLAASGDTDGDGFPDILVGAPYVDGPSSDEGSAYLVLGTHIDITDLSDADAILVGEANSDLAGQALAGPGDVDGDGYDDLLVGAPGHDSLATDDGAAYLLLGPTTGTVDLGTADAILMGETSNACRDMSLAGAGDQDEDGHADLLLGAPGDDAHNLGTGAAYLVLGPVTGSVCLEEAERKAIGEASYYWAGSGVAAGGDVNGDGSPDLLVGSDRARESANRAGAVYLLLGPLF